jgi:hypothetical protein
MNAKGKRRVPLIDAEGETFKIYPWLSKRFILVSLYFFFFVFYEYNAVLKEVDATGYTIYSTSVTRDSEKNL